jgi:hypothetical protein
LLAIFEIFRPGLASKFVKSANKTKKKRKKAVLYADFKFDDKNVKLLPYKSVQQFYDH